MEAITKSRSFTVWTRPLLNEDQSPESKARRSLADKARGLVRFAGSRTKKTATDLKKFAGRKMQQPASKASRAVSRIMQEKETNGSAPAVRDEAEPSVMGAMMRWVMVPLVLLLAFIAYFQLSEQVRDLKASVLKLDSDLGTARANLAALSQHNGILQQEKAALIAERGELQATVAGLETDLSTERQTVTNLSNELVATNRTLEETITRFETRVNALEGINESQKSMIAVRDELIANLEGEVEARDARIESQIQVITEGEKMIASLEDKVAGEAKENEALRAKASILRDDLNLAFDKIDTLGKEVAAAAQAAEALTIRGASLEEELAVSYAQTEVLEEEKVQAESRLSEIRGILASADVPRALPAGVEEGDGQVGSVQETPKPAVGFPVPSKRTGLDLVSFRKLVSVDGR